MQSYTGTGPQTINVLVWGSSAIGQYRVFNLRGRLTRIGGTGDVFATVKVNGDDVPLPEGEFQLKATHADPVCTDSADLWLTVRPGANPETDPPVGDSVQIQIEGGAQWALQVSGATATEEL